MSNVWTREIEIGAILVNPQKRLGLYGALNVVQDVAWAHATHVGHGFDDSMKRGTFWVMSRQRLVMSEWPEWGEKIRVDTWLRPPQLPFANRDFEIFKGDRKIGESTIGFVLLDATTRKPLRKGVGDLDLPIANNQMQSITSDRALTIDAPKLEVIPGLQKVAQFVVRNSDLDVNEHVNNTRYAQWVLDSLPRENLRQYLLHQYDVNFIAETKMGDTISIEKSDRLPVAGERLSTQFQGVREADSKLVFTARLEISEKRP